MTEYDVAPTSCKKGGTTVIDGSTMMIADMVYMCVYSRTIVYELPSIFEPSYIFLFTLEIFKIKNTILEIY